MQGGPDQLEEYVFSETSQLGHELRMISSLHYKLVTHLPLNGKLTKEDGGSVPEVARPFRGSVFYDLKNDPKEQHDLLKSTQAPPPEYGQLENLLDSWIMLLAQTGRKGKEVKLGREEMKDLRALGYVK